jgi:hypothetical protein
MAALLRDLAARRPPSPYLTRLLAAFDAESIAAAAPAAPRPTTDPALDLLGRLTEREVQVLAR